MHLSPKQSERFYRLYYSLLGYANETFHILEEPFVPFDEETGSMQILDLSLQIFGDRDEDRDGEDGSDASSLATTEEIIDSYLAANPLRLGKADLEQVAQWKSAIAGAFYLMEHTVFSAFMLGDCLFNVVGLTRDISVSVPETPAVVETVLLPFDGAIVYGISISEYPVVIGPTMLGNLQDEYARLRAKGPKATCAEEFLREAPLCMQRSRERRAEDRAFLEEGRDTIDEPAQGAHKGVLAGMTPDEREAAVSAHFDQTASQSRREVQEGLNSLYLYTYEPERSLLDILDLTSKKELTALAKQEGMRGYSKLSKMELVVELWNHFEARRYSLPHSLAAVGIPAILTLGERTYRAGGMLEISRAEHDALPLGERWVPCPPFLYVFDCGSTLYSVIPTEFMEKTDDELWGAALQEERMLDRARHLINTYLELCGIIGLDTLTQLYLRYYPAEYDAVEFEDVVLLAGPSTFKCYNLWVYKGREFVIHENLVDEDLEVALGEQVRIDGDKLRKIGPEELFRRRLLESHSKFEPWEVPSKTAAELEAFDVYTATRELPSGRALRDFLDANVPDGADDCFYAELIMENVEVAAMIDIPPAQILDFVMEESGGTLDSGAKLELLLGLLMGYVNDIPRWSNNGWSPNACRTRGGQAGSKKTFYDESGRPRKVGRNEPCPCGSGKKYKRCCGR